MDVRIFYAYEKRIFDLVIFSDNSRKVRLHVRIMSPLRNLKILFPVFHSRQKENTVRFMMQHFRGIMYYDFTLRISIACVSRRQRYIAVPCRFSVHVSAPLTFTSGTFAFLSKKTRHEVSSRGSLMRRMSTLVLRRQIVASH